MSIADVALLRFCLRPSCRLSPARVGGVAGGLNGAARRVRLGEICTLVRGRSHHNLVNPSSLQFSLPTPWCAKKRPSGSNLFLIASKAG